MTSKELNLKFDYAVNEYKKYLINRDQNKDTVNDSLENLNGLLFTFFVIGVAAGCQDMKAYKKDIKEILFK